MKVKLSMEVKVILSFGIEVFSGALCFSVYFPMHLNYCRLEVGLFIVFQERY